MSKLPRRPPWDDSEPASDVDVPYNVVTSKGGLYDDVSFMAGIQFGQIRRTLYDRDVCAATALVYSDLVTQIDLLAMAHGYTCDILMEDHFWTHLGFTRIEKDEDAL